METMIQLERFAKDDFSSLISWVDSEETLVQFAGTIFSFPLTNQQLETYIKDRKRNAYKVVNTGNNATIGHAEIYTSDDRIARLCRILIGNNKFRGIGIGGKIVNRLLEMSFNNPGAISTSLNVFDWNIPAIKCYEKAGFILTKNHSRKTIVKGEVWTKINMLINKMAWEKLNKKEC